MANINNNTSRPSNTPIQNDGADTAPTPAPAPAAGSGSPTTKTPPEFLLLGGVGGGYSNATPYPVYGNGELRIGQLWNNEIGWSIGGGVDITGQNIFSTTGDSSNQSINTPPSDGNQVQCLDENGFKTTDCSTTNTTHTDSTKTKQTVPAVYGYINPAVEVRNGQAVFRAGPAVALTPNGFGAGGTIFAGGQTKNKRVQAGGHLSVLAPINGEPVRVFAGAQVLFGPSQSSVAAPNADHDNDGIMDAQETCPTPTTGDVAIATTQKTELENFINSTNYSIEVIPNQSVVVPSVQDSLKGVLSLPNGETVSAMTVELVQASLFKSNSVSESDLTPVIVVTSNNGNKYYLTYNDNGVTKPLNDISQLETSFIRGNISLTINSQNIQVDSFNKVAFLQGKPTPTEVNNVLTALYAINNYKTGDALSPDVIKLLTSFKIKVSDLTDDKKERNIKLVLASVFQGEASVDSVLKGLKNLSQLPKSWTVGIVGNTDNSKFKGRTAQQSIEMNRALSQARAQFIAALKLVFDNSSANPLYTITPDGKVTVINLYRDVPGYSSGNGQQNAHNTKDKVTQAFDRQVELHIEIPESGASASGTFKIDGTVLDPNVGLAQIPADYDATKTASFTTYSQDTSSHAWTQGPTITVDPCGEETILAVAVTPSAPTAATLTPTPPTPPAPAATPPAPAATTTATPAPASAASSLPIIFEGVPADVTAIGTKFSDLRQEIAGEFNRTTNSYDNIEGATALNKIDTIISRLTELKSKWTLFETTYKNETGFDSAIGRVIDDAIQKATEKRTTLSSTSSRTSSTNPSPTPPAVPAPMGVRGSGAGVTDAATALATPSFTATNVSAPGTTGDAQSSNQTTYPASYNILSAHPPASDDPTATLYAMLDGRKIKINNKEYDYTSSTLAQTLSDSLANPNDETKAKAVYTNLASNKALATTNIKIGEILLDSIPADAQHKALRSKIAQLISACWVIQYIPITTTSEDGSTTNTSAGDNTYATRIQTLLQNEINQYVLTPEEARGIINTVLDINQIKNRTDITTIRTALNGITLSNASTSGTTTTTTPPPPPAYKPAIQSTSLTNNTIPLGSSNTTFTITLAAPLPSTANATVTLDRKTVTATPSTDRTTLTITVPVATVSGLLVRVKDKDKNGDATSYTIPENHIASLKVKVGSESTTKDIKLTQTPEQAANTCTNLGGELSGTTCTIPPI